MRPVALAQPKSFGSGASCGSMVAGVRPATVHRHMAVLFDQLRAADRAQVIVRAQEAGAGSMGQSVAGTASGEPMGRRPSDNERFPTFHEVFFGR